MKKYLIHVLVIFGCICFGLTSCQLAVDAQNEGDIKGSIEQIVISTKMPDGFKKGVAYAGQKVILQSNRMTYTAVTDENGNATFKNVIPDVYAISTSWKLSAGEYIDLSESTEVENNSVILTSSVANKQLFEKTNLTLELNKMVEQTLIISKIYFSGTKDNKNRSYIQDKYLEIFNNSESTQYIDGLYVALTENDATPIFPAATNKGYIYVRQVFQFPGTGKDYPVEPGASIVVCNSAINHLLNAPISTNLSSADFEVKNTNFINNPDIKPMNLIYTNLKIIFMNMVQGSDNGIVLFRTNKDVLNDYPEFYKPGKTSGVMHKRIPDTVILDGVETLKNKSTGIDITSKRIPSFVDSSYGYTNSSSGYTHESIERRVDISRSTATRVYLVDTNNTLSDFRTITDPTPRKYDKALLIEK